jgi:hypothetical protein
MLNDPWPYTEQLDTIVKPTNEHKCVEVYYKPSYSPMCFGNSCGFKSNFSLLVVTIDGDLVCNIIGHQLV